MKQPPTSTPKPPIRWQGIIFAFAANLLLVTVSSYFAPLERGALAVIVGGVMAIVAGALTALYVRQRGGIHAFVGGMLSVPILAVAIYAGFWQPALVTGALCAFGGALVEIATRGRVG